MKRRIAFLITFFITAIGLKSQNSFEFILEDTLSSACYYTFTDDQNYFVSIGESCNPDIYECGGMILKYKNPDNIEIKKIHKPDTLIALKFGFQMSNGNYSVYGLIDNDNDLDYGNLYVMQLNQDLEIISENIYAIPSIYDRLSLMNFIIDNDSIVIIDGAVDDPPPGNINDVYVAKLDMQGNLLDTLFSSQFDADYKNELLKKPDNTGYYLVGDFGWVRQIELDNNINIVGYQLMSPDYGYYGAVGARFLSNGNIIIGSLVNNSVPNAFYDLQMRITDENLVPILDTVIFDEGFNWLPLLHGLDYSDENNIWVVTYPQLGKSTSDWEFGRIYIFDSELNVKGAKYFGGTSSLYLYSVKALDDGGCIITGIAADEQKKGFKDVYIKKVVAEDILTNAEDTPESNDMDVLLYPIPFNDKLFIETYRKNLTFTLYSTNGKCIIDKNRLINPKTTIETSDLEKGFYIYSIYDNEKIIQTDKIIKQ